MSRSRSAILQTVWESRAMGVARLKEDAREGGREGGRKRMNVR
jgi:hypothetical protein